LVQSAFEQVVRTLQRGTYSRNCSLTSWASAIASNVALNELRARRRDRQYFVEVDPTPRARAGGDVEAQVIARRRLQLARLELSKMNPQRAQAVILHDVNGLPIEEMAAALGVTVAAAQSRLSRGRREISARVEGFENDCNPALESKETPS
jgi:RNA polymerase sigma-70 factor (ECF subfamily)